MTKQAQIVLAPEVVLVDGLRQALSQVQLLLVELAQRLLAIFVEGDVARRIALAPALVTSRHLPPIRSVPSL